MSSDSDDDCYDNIAQRLEQMKNKFQEDKIENANLLDDSAEFDEIVKKTAEKAKSIQKSSSIGSDNTAGPSVSNPDGNEGNRRVTRSAARNQSTEDIVEDLPPSRARRRRTNPSSRSPSPKRGGGRGRPKKPRNASTSRARGRRGGRNRNFHITSYEEALMMPVYSIGDADEVNDLSRGQALFSAPKSNDIVVIDENDPLDDNEELSVKVYWQSCEFFRFTVRKYQKLTQIFDYFTEKKNVSQDKLLFTYNEKIIHPNDTPDSIGYNIVKFIEGGIVNKSVSQLVTNDNEIVKNGVKIKFQCQNVKKPFDIMIRLDDKFSMAMTKCAEHLEIPLNKLRFEFDGDTISGKSTAREMELEGGECIDVKIIS